MNKKLRNLIISTFYIVFLSGFIIGQQQLSTRTVGNYGQVVTVGCEVYWNTNLTNPVSVIDWGTLGYNDTRNFTVYVDSLSNVNSTLTVIAQNWVPVDAEVLVFSIQPNLTVIEPDEILPVQTSLHVSPLIPITNFSTFSFDIMFSISE